MTTLAANTPRVFEVGDRGEYPVIAADIIYEGAAVGLVDATGHARPLNAADRFVGFAEARADNAAGAAAAINVRTHKRGAVQLSISGAVITDVGQPVYATDDNTFALSPVGGVFIGVIERFVSSGVAVVEFDIGWPDPWADFPVRETLADDKTLDAQDTGKLFVQTVDAKTVTLPVTATAGLRIAVMCGAAFGTVAVKVDTDNADKIMGPDLAGSDGKYLINTKATARRGDYVVLSAGHADGWIITGQRGIWASE